MGSETLKKQTPQKTKPQTSPSHPAGNSLSSTKSMNHISCQSTVFVQITQSHAVVLHYTHYISPDVNCFQFKVTFSNSQNLFSVPLFFIHIKSCLYFNYDEIIHEGKDLSLKNIYLLSRQAETNRLKPTDVFPAPYGFKIQQGRQITKCQYS